MTTPPLRASFIVFALFASLGYASREAFLGPTARPLLVAADALALTPIRPAPGDILTVGDNATVMWDASLVPDEAPVVPRIDLYRNTTVGLAQFIANLAQDVDPHTGAVGFAVPPVESGSYLIWAASTGPAAVSSRSSRATRFQN